RLRSRNAYINRRYGYELEPAPSLGLPLAYARPRSRAADDRVFRHLPRPRRGARLLDVGCGSGAFVARAIALGWNAQGIDNDEAAVRAGQAAGLPLSTTPIEELAVSMRGSFDAVTMAHVIEHVPHPVTFLGAARALLRDSGTLWLATPNLDSSGHRRFGERWMHLDPPRHLVLFGQLAIDRALGSAGFEILSTPSSASGTIASYAQSSRIAQGRLPISDSRVPPLVRAGGLAAGLRSLLQSTLSEELIRLARPRTGR
ncbi:class I SAM-dependent methyltransferase, partial [Aromatoleum sp.]|uniref:class I SAM-dependent methyltransferase n=1 Tax=Aromatoleum sp. TaxID=2307007 RepID=UPI002FC7A388